MAFDHEIILLQIVIVSKRTGIFTQEVFLSRVQNKEKEFVSFVKYKLTTMCIMHYYCVY